MQRYIESSTGRATVSKPVTAVLRQWPATAPGPRLWGGHTTAPTVLRPATADREQRDRQTTATAVAGLSSPSRSARTERVAWHTTPTVVGIRVSSPGTSPRA